MRSRAVLCSCLLLSACSLARFQAHADRNLTESAQGLTGIECSSHNGDISVVGVRGQQQVAIAARLSARGDSEIDAIANVARLEVAVVRSNGVLRIEGKVPEDFGWRFSPSFAFVLEVPAELAATLTSHNGDLAVRGLDGRLVATTHNGRITADTGADALQVRTHNGDVQLDLAGGGSVAGAVTTHNGSIEVDLGQRAAVVEASTHNGGLSAVRAFAQLEQRDNWLCGRTGQGGGRLQLDTHNGSVTIR